QYRWDKRAQGPENQPVATAQLKVLQCPSAPPDRWVTAVEDPRNYSYGGWGAAGDYAGILQIDGSLVALGLVDPADNYLGALARLAAVTDGTPQTILIIEHAGRPTVWRAGRPVPGVYTVSAAWVAGNPVLGQGSSYDGTTKLGPCAINCTNDHEAYSFHPGGA